MSHDFLDWLAATGFDTVLLALPRYFGTADVTLPPLVAAARDRGLNVTLDLTLHMAREESTIARRHPEWFAQPPRRFADPRTAPVPAGLRLLNLSASAGAISEFTEFSEFTEYWAEAIARLSDQGITGFRCVPHAALPAPVWRDLIAGAPELEFSAWAPGASLDDIPMLPARCFSVCYNSLAWWDFSAGWFRDEAARLAAIAPIANTVGLPTCSVSGPTTWQIARRLLGVAAHNGRGFLLPMGFEFGFGSDLTHPEFGADDWPRLRQNALLDLTGALRAANESAAGRDANERAAGLGDAASAEIISGAHAPVAALFEPPGQLTLVNSHLTRFAECDLAGLLPLLDGKVAGFTDASGHKPGAAPLRLEPAEVRVFTGTPARAIVTAAPYEHGKADPDTERRVIAAASAGRLAIEAISPIVEAGRFAVKRLAGERVTVAADIIVDGHGKIAAALQWRAKDETDWRDVPMTFVANDRWSGDWLPERVGPHLFRIIAWPDRFATWRDEVGKKHAAGLDVTLELEEGALLIGAIVQGSRIQGSQNGANAEAHGALAPLLHSLGHARPRETDRFAVLTDAATAAAVARVDARPGLVVSAEIPLDADRRAAEFASWYELFPRNQTDDPARHGTFRDVIKRLPAIRAMGFDVVYLPPIHPIGRTNRKGRDNALTASEDDPGSPYAIGAEAGGHDAINPRLGTIEDFRALRDAAAAAGLEIALDFAVQCSPDHPWLRDHKEWFDWRPDGGLRYAENPPKKYEDIVNVDFYQAGAVPGLWLALRDIVAYWADQGVRIFRVDNPHTKPFAFWEWLIADIRARWPDTIFLSEAFTRPKVMYRLAKLGFTQSYTYFTWRNEKWEIEEYLRELTGAAPSEASADSVPDFFRPNLFVNTPDINPIFLQNSGRAGFLIRAALATTLSGLWGMLQGFEFCEAAPVPGREEYAHSDKYEIRVRQERAPGDIVDEITRLNAIRRANPALRSHRGLAFHIAQNDRVLWYRKQSVDRANVVLVAVSLDPRASQTATVEVPLWEWGLDDDASLIVDDLMHGGSDVWSGKYRAITLDPRVLPFGIWRARPRETF
jgi:starch synthase (maltosyl-transferring)